MLIHIRELDRRELPGFCPYLLPETAARLEREEPGLMAVGAVTGRSSCAAAAAAAAGDSAVLTDLFVDETVRRRGVGGLVLDALLERLDAMGVGQVEAGYVLRGTSLAAMDALLTGRGFSPPQVRSRVFRMEMADFRGDRLLGAALTPRYRTPKNICGLGALPPGALDELEGEVPYALRWSTLADRADPDLSAALVREGRVLAYQLAGECSGGFALLAAFSGREAPATSFLPLLREVINRCWYRWGGRAAFYCSALTPRVEALVLRLAGERAVVYEERTCRRPGPSGGAPAS